MIPPYKIVVDYKNISFIDNVREPARATTDMRIKALVVRHNALFPLSFCEPSRQKLPRFAG